MRRTDYPDSSLVVAPLSGRWQVEARRTLLGAIAAAALAFFVCQWLLAPPVSASNPGAPLAATPALVYSSEDLPDEIDLGESFDLEILVAEYSGQGDRGGISVSFPGLTATGGNSSSYDSSQGNVETISYTNGVSMVSYHDEGDQIHRGTDTSTSAADYLLVESDDGNWPSRTGDDYEWRILKLRVTPKQTGEFKVYYRVWLCGDGYQECDRRPRPEHSDQEDQQRWAVAVITVDVTNPVSPTGDFARDPDEDFDTLDDAGNDNPKGIWSDGTTMWVVDDGDGKIYAYILNTKARDSAKDFNTLDAAGNDGPTGIWSDDTTMWVADGYDDKLYAYNMATKARDSDKDFNTLENAENERPEGIWSDGTTMWVADSSDDKIYAYSMDSKARVSSKDFNTLENAENERPEGIWSDGTTMWVADYSDDKIYAYNLSTKARVFSKDFDTLDAARNDHPTGLWSDRTTVWVADYSDDKIYAYNAPEMAPAPAISNRAPSVSKVTPTSASVSLYVGNSQTFDASANDPDDNLTSWDWSIDGTSENNGRFGFWPFYNSPTGTVTKEFTHTFSSAGTYTVRATFTDKGGRSASVTWTVEVINRAPVISSASPSSSHVLLTMGDSQTFEATVSDADNNLKSWDWSVDVTSEDSGNWGILFSPTPTGSVTKSFSHTFSAVGGYKVRATFADTEGDSDSQEWMVQVVQESGDYERDSEKDFNTLDAAGNGSPAGIWSDGTTMWVADYSDYKVYAYNLSTKARDSAKDFNTLDAAGNEDPAGIWSDKTTMWVADYSDDKIYAYNLSTKARDSGKDFNTLDAAGNEDPAGIWSDKTTMWVADYSDEKIYAYNLSTKARDFGKDFNTLEDAENEGPEGIWSDGTTMWVADYSDEKIYAYNLSAKARDFGKDFNTLDAAGNEGPAGIWSDGTTMWVADYSDDKIYAYDGPGMAAPTQPEPTNSPPAVSKVTPTSASVSLYVGNSQTFEASANDPDDNLTGWDWSIDGASEDNGRFGILLIYNSPTGTVTKEFTRTFSSAGTYTVKATFTDKGGRSGSVTWTVEVINRAPVISSATPPPSSTVSLTAGDSQTFEATVSDPDNNLKSWDWSVDSTSEDSGTWGTLLSSTPAGSVTKSFSHTFSSVGTYTVKATFTDAEGNSDSEEWTVQVTGQDQAIYRWSNLGVTVVKIAATCESNLASVGIGEDVTFTSRVAGMVTPLNSSIKIYMKPVVKETLRGIDAPDSVKTESASIGVGDEVTLTYEGGTVHPGEYEFGCRFYWEQAGPLPDSELTKQGASPSLNRVSVDRGWGIYSGSADTELNKCGAVDKTPPFLVGEDIALQSKGHGERRIPGYYFGLLFVHHDGALIDGMFGHRIGTGFSSSGTSSRPLVSGTHTFDSPGEYIVDCELHYQGGVWVPYNPLQDPEEKLKKLVEMLIVIYFKPEKLIDTAIQVALREFIGVTSTRLTVVEARWGTAGLGIERGTEMLLNGRERIRVRVSREETENREVGRRIRAPKFHVNGPELDQSKDATHCGEGDQDQYLSLCWETTFDIPVNDTKNPRDYSVWVESDLIEDDQTNGFTVVASPDAAGLTAFYGATGGPNWVNKDGWLSNDPIGDWYGVDTNAGGRVVKLDLRGNGLQGPLPSDLKDTLPFLQTLYLGGNGGLTECVREDLLDVQTNDLKSLDLPTCEDTCAWGGALPDPDNQGLVADCEALLAARDTLTAGQPNGRLNWSAREHIGTWRGVVREGNPERVIRLEIKQPPLLWGYISREIAKLSGLQVLTLANAGLRGEIPEELKDLANLNTLNLQGNQLTGRIPRELSGLTSLHTLDLSDNELEGGIPERLTSLVNLQTLRLDGNQFSGCIPEGLRGIENNDLASLGLLFCDVLLSGLTISPGVLAPAFTSYQTAYTAAVGPSPITVTPANAHNAAIAFLGENDAPIPDADGALAGHQVDLGDGTTTIKIKVTSQDGKASLTYAIEVTRSGLPAAPAIAGPIAAGPASLTVSWTAPAETGGTDATSYDLRHIESGAADKADANWTVVVGAWTSGPLSYTIESLTGGTQYDVQVRAVNGAGPGPWSATVTGTPDLGGCSTGGAVADAANNPGLVADCEVLLAARDTLAGTASLNWAANTSIGEWDGITVGGTPPRVTGLALVQKQLTGETPPALASLSNLGYLRLGGNDFTGCIPEGLRRVADNDLAGLGLPFCDVLLSGLAISPGVLTPQFESDHTDYTAEVDQPRLTIIPSSLHNAAIEFLDENDAPIPDANGALAGHQVDLGDGATTIKIKVTSQDGKASLTYAIEVTRSGLPDAPAIAGPIAAGPASLTVFWTAPAETGGTDVTSYDLRHIESGAADKADANWTVVEGAWTTGPLSYTIESLTGGTQYDVQVRAVTGIGDGPWSATATGTPATWGAIRSFSPASVAPGGGVVVTINAASYGVGGAVTETLPEGFTYVSSSLPNSQVSVTGQQVRFTLQGDTSFTYTVTAPSVEGSYAFSGTLRDDERNDHDVGGDATVTVSSRDPLGARYDANNNGTIERGEVITAINDYLFGGGDDAITRAEVIKLINLYLFGPTLN